MAIAVYGPLWWLTVVVVAEQCGGRAARDEGRGLRVVGSSPTSGFEVGVTARSGKVQNRLLPPAHLPSELGVSIKAAAIIYFGGVCGPIFK